MCHHVTGMPIHSLAVLYICLICVLWCVGFHFILIIYGQPVSKMTYDMLNRTLNSSLSSYIISHLLIYICILRHFFAEYILRK